MLVARNLFDLPVGDDVSIEATGQSQYVNDVRWKRNKRTILLILLPAPDDDFAAEVFGDESHADRKARRRISFVVLPVFSEERWEFEEMLLHPLGVGTYDEKEILWFIAIKILPMGADNLIFENRNLFNRM